MGAIWGDPYTIGGNGDDPPSEPLESVVSPPSRGAMGLWGLVTPQTSSPENRVHRPTVALAPHGVAPMAPPLLLGGVVLK